MLLFFNLLWFWLVNFVPHCNKLIICFVVYRIVILTTPKGDMRILVRHNASVDVHCPLRADTLVWYTEEDIEHAMKRIHSLIIDVGIKLQEEC